MHNYALKVHAEPLIGLWLVLFRHSEKGRLINAIVESLQALLSSNRIQLVFE